MQDIINGKVAALIDDTTLVLNVGFQEGVQVGMAFVIFAEYQEILDPDSGELLGKWEMVKARVVVDHVQERMCTVRSVLVSEEDRPGTLSAMMVQHSFGQYGQQNAERESLDISSRDSRGRPQLQPIALGDGARSVERREDGQNAVPETGDEKPSQAAGPAHQEAAEEGKKGEGPDA